MNKLIQDWKEMIMDKNLNKEMTRAMLGCILVSVALHFGF